VEQYILDHYVLMVKNKGKCIGNCSTCIDFCGEELSTYCHSILVNIIYDFDEYHSNCRYKFIINKLIELGKEHLIFEELI